MRNDAANALMKTAKVDPLTLSVQVSAYVALAASARHRAVASLISGERMRIESTVYRTAGTRYPQTVT